MLLKQAKLLDNNEEVIKDILIKNGKIIKIEDDIENDNDKIIELQGKLVTPGLIDVHVHFREPGFEHKETIKTGSKAAARGGYTTVCPMPNTNPIVDSIEVLDQVNDIIKKDAVIKVLPYVSITKSLNGEQLVDFDALKAHGAFAFTDDGVGVQNSQMMYEAMQHASKINMPIVAHTEDDSLAGSGVVHKGEISERLGIEGIPNIAEATQIARDVLLAEAADCHYHVCHVSTKESVRVIRDAKRAGIQVTAEVTPHHLVFDENDFTDYNANFKMNPPLRSTKDREALIEGLRDGTIDFIATDHAPHHIDEKQMGVENAPFGIVGIEHAFQLLYTKLVKTNIFSLQALIDYMTLKPSKTFRLESGELKVGRKADITVIDLEDSVTIEPNNFVSKASNSPFIGETLDSDIYMTICDGQIVYEKN